MASAGAPYRLVPAHFCLCFGALILVVDGRKDSRPVNTWLQLSPKVGEERTHGAAGDSYSLVRTAIKWK